MADPKPVDPALAAVADHFAGAFLRFQDDLLGHVQGRVPRLLRGAVVGLPEPMLRRFAREIAAGVTLAMQLHTEQLLAEPVRLRDAA